MVVRCSPAAFRTLARGVPDLPDDIQQEMDDLRKNAKRWQAQYDQLKITTSRQNAKEKRERSQRRDRSPQQRKPSNGGGGGQGGVGSKDGKTRARSNDNRRQFQQEHRRRRGTQDVRGRQ